MKDRRLALWQKENKASEDLLRSKVRAFLRAQRKRVLEALEAHQEIPTAALLIDLQTEHDAFLADVGPVLGHLIGVGADLELQALEGSKQFTVSTDLDLPPNILQAAQTALDELTQQPYWQTIQATTLANLDGLIEQALVNGDSIATLAKTVNRVLGGQADWRSTAIARTETTGALNAGHHAVFTEYEASGAIDGREWSSVNGSTSRQTHMDADGQIQRGGENFDLDGFACPYPGWHGLPAKERVHCQCTVLPVIDLG